MDVLLRSIPVLGWLLLSVAFYATGEYLSKKWALHPSTGLIFSILIVNTLSTLLWLPAIYQRTELAIVGLLWILLGVIATTSIGILIFHEQLTTGQWIGLGLSVIALVLLSR